jgi:hypothetical protein
MHPGQVLVVAPESARAVSVETPLGAAAPPLPGLTLIRPRRGRVSPLNASGETPGAGDKVMLFRLITFSE